jgi:uncharacterized protein (DUF849 family)
MDVGLYEQVVSRIRSRNGELILNLTTGPGSRYVPDADDPKRGRAGPSLTQPANRVAHVLALRPEICSLDVATMNLGPSPIINTPGHMRAIAQLVRDAGVKPELEVFELGHMEQAKSLIAEGFITGAPLIQICLGAPGGAPARPSVMLAMQELLPANSVWSAFGFGAQSFAMVGQAVVLGGHVRVGMEDNVFIEEDRFATGNAELVAHAKRIVQDLGGSVASTKTARRLLDLA